MSIRGFLVLFVFFAVLSSCSKFRKIQKSEDIDKKLNAAFAYYEDKDYYKSNLLLEEIIPLIKGRAEAEKAEFIFAKGYYEDEQYVLSSYYLKDFAATYPRSQYAEESMFLYVKSLYNDSPHYNLDQTNTEEALEATQTFANKYPKSVHLEEINKITDELNAKIELKDYENAKLYSKLSNYKSAIVAFNEFLKIHPSSLFAEEITFLLFQSKYNLAKLSVPGKQKERYYDAVESYLSFIDKYPTSKYTKDAEQLYVYCTTRLKMLNS